MAPGARRESSSERTIRRGRVVDFDEHVGLGHVADASGAELLFHCVEIADGSRTIPVGQDVEFELLRKFGKDEAANLRPAP
jgi:cold shock CspA family protein